MVDVLFARRCREFEALERRTAPALEKTIAAFHSSIADARGRLERLTALHATLSAALAAPALTAFALPLPKSTERAHRVKRRRYSDAVYNSEQLNPWQHHCLVRIRAPRHRVPRHEPASDTPRDAVDAFLRDVVPFWRYISLTAARTATVASISTLRAHLDDLSARVDDANKQRAHIFERSEYTEFTFRATPYLETHQILVQQRNALGSIADPAERAAAVNDINARLEYFRIKFVTEFLPDTLDSDEARAYQAFVDKHGPRFERATAAGTPIAGAHPQFSRVNPSGTGRVAKTITRQRKRTIQEIISNCEIDDYVCPLCDATLRRDPQRTVCVTTGCGFTRPGVDYAAPVLGPDSCYNAPVRTSACLYRRLNHFRECLRHIEAQGLKDELRAIADELREEFRRYRVDLARITPPRVRKQLRQLHAVSRDVRYTRFYEHVEVITAALHKKHQVLTIPPQRKAQLYHFFEYVEGVFDIIQPRIPWVRKNYLSYPYAGYKICQLLGWYEYLPAFKLLKTRHLVTRQDVIWQLICEEAGFKYQPTIGNVYGVVGVAAGTETAEAPTTPVPAPAAVAAVAPATAVTQ